MNYLALCMSPAVDTSIALPKFPQAGDVIKGADEVFSIGGKGLNVARWLSLRGCSVTLAGLLGAIDAYRFEEELARYNITDAMLRVPGATRVNIMFTSPCGMFKMNRPAFPQLSPQDWSTEKILSQIFTFRGGADAPAVVILTGSLPSAVPAPFYASLIPQLRERGIHTVLDSSGEALTLGVAKGPDLIKPNRPECAELLGFTLSTEADFLRAAKQLLGQCPFVIISDGANGCYFATRTPETAVYRVNSPLVPVLDTTGAGDSLLAEFCYRHYECSLPLEETMRWAVAVGAAATTIPGSAPPDPQKISALLPEIRITSLR